MNFNLNFVFDPIKAAIARAQTSSNPVAKAVAAAAGAAVAQVQTDVTQPSLTHNSAAGIANAVIGDLETSLKAGVDAFVVASVPAGLGAAFVVPVNAAIDFAEQHALTYLSALFAHHRANVAASLVPAK